MLTNQPFHFPTHALSATRSLMQKKAASGLAACVLLACSTSAHAAAPTITSPATATVIEGVTRALDVNAIDDTSADLDGLSYSISGGPDAAQFAIDAMTGVLRFNAISGAANPLDADFDNIYNVEITVADADGESTSQSVEIAVSPRGGLARTWHIDGLTFDTGAWASGSFRFDPSIGDFGAFTNIDVKVTRNGQTNTYVAVSPFSPGNAGFLGLVTQQNGDLTGTPLLALSLDGSMTSLGDDLQILPGPANLSYQGSCVNPNCAGGAGPFDEANQGGRVVAGDRTWVIENLAFSSGATVGGTFNFDPDAMPGEQFSNLHVRATINGVASDFTGAHPTRDSDADTLWLVKDRESDLTGTPLLGLALTDTMTAVDGSISIHAGSAQHDSYLSLCANADCSLTIDGGIDQAQAGAHVRAYPKPQTWYIEGLRLDDGSTVTGYFDFNPGPNNVVGLSGRSGRFSNINVTSRNNGIDTHFTTNRSVSPGNREYMNFVTRDGVDLSGTPVIAMSLASPMTTEGPLAILPGPQNLSFQGFCGGQNCAANNGPYGEALAGGRLVRELVSPEFSTAPFVNVLENQTAVTDIDALDNLDSEGNGLVYSLSGGADQTLFSLNPNSGVLSFANAPDFEAPGDADADNGYQVQITVTDLGGLSAVLDMEIFVVDDLSDNDTTPPVANPVFNPMPNDVGWNNTNVVVTWNWEDPAGAGEGAPSGLDTFTCAFASETALEGINELTASCSDLAGNGSNAAVAVRIDRTAPEVALTNAPPPVNGGNVSIEFGGADGGSGIAGYECTLQFGEASSISPCTSPFSTTDLADGQYTFSVRAIDRAGNTSPTPASVAWTVQNLDTDADGVADIADNCTLVANSDQRDTDGDGFGNLCDADLNNDGVVNVLDLGMFRSVFFGSDPNADFNGDGVVNVVDLGILRAGFFGAPGPSGVTN